MHNIPGKDGEKKKSKFDEYDEKLLFFSTDLTEQRNHANAILDRLEKEMEMNNIRVDSKVIKLDGFKDQVDQVAAAHDSLRDHFTKSVKEMTTLLDEVKRQTMDQFQEVFQKIVDLRIEIKDIPSNLSQAVLRIKGLE